MYNELFSIGPFTIYTYGLLIAVGILLAFFVAEKRGREMGMDVSILDTLAFWVLIGGFTCSKLLYLTTRLPEVLTDPSIILDFGNGWVVYGGLFGGLLGGWLYLKTKGLNFWQYFDLLIPEVALAQALGRLGCFFAGCCYGIETHGWWGIVFPEHSMAPAGIPLFPTQLLSAVYDFLMFLILLKLAKRIRFHGELGAWYLIMYSLGRFVIEFFRGDLVRGEVGLLSTSQFISIFALIAGIVILWIGSRRAKEQKTA